MLPGQSLARTFCYCDEVVVDNIQIQMLTCWMDLSVTGNCSISVIASSL